MLQRLDIFLVENNFFESRQKAHDAIANNLVKINGIIANKPSIKVSESDNIEIISQMLQFVSRGGLKLQKAIDEFNIDFASKTILDVGASTGGFTDCALQNGASKVFAVDNGSNQLHKSLKDNPKVVSYENMNIKDFTLEMTDNQQVDLIVSDVSFISITKVFTFFIPFLKPDGKIVILIKPQFEAGLKNIDDNGIVKNPNSHIKLINQIAEFCNKQGFYVNKLTNAPIYDKRKNIEYLALISKQKSILPNIQNIVNISFETQKNIGN